MRAQVPQTNQSVKKAASVVPAILANSTRLELVIVAAALLVLMLSSKPPRSGNAEVRTPSAEIPARMSISRQESAPMTSTSMQGNETIRSDDMPPMDMKPRMKRVGIVDARNCGNPKYKDLLYGEVTVRSVWNGGKFVWQKVCIVDEGNGVTSVWSFDQQNGITITEREEPITAP